jgi:hypothetical protein
MESPRRKPTVMPDTSPSPSRPAARRARPKSVDQADPKAHPAAPARPHQADSPRPGKSGAAPAERHGPRWRDLQWVDFTFDSEPEPEAPLPPIPQPDADTPAAAAPPREGDGFSLILRQFAGAAPGSGSDDIPGLASRFARLPVPRPMAPRAVSARPAWLKFATPTLPESPAEAVGFEAGPAADTTAAQPRPPEPSLPVAAPHRETGREPAPAEIPAPEPPTLPAAGRKAAAREDERFPASFLTAVGTAPEPTPPPPSIAQTLGAQLRRASAVLRRQRESVGIAANTGLARAGAALRWSTRPPAPAVKPEPAPISVPPPEPPSARFLSPPANLEPAAETTAPSDPMSHLPPPSRVFADAEPALRLTHDDPEPSRRWLTVAGGVTVIAVVAYAVGALLAGLIHFDARPLAVSEPASRIQAATPPPQPQPPQPQPPPPAAPVAAIPPSEPVARAAFYLARAKAGDSVAQYDVAVLYAQGSGLVQDYASAASWFHAAAAQGNIDAEYNLGVLYEHGLGVTANPIEAVNWYRSAADQNHARAQYNLGLAYAEGRGTEQDLAAAARWYQRAAQQGLTPAMVNLAIAYERGQGLDRSLIDAYAWYSAAAERSDDPARDRAGELLRQFSDQDKAKAQGLAATVAASINNVRPPPA